MSLLTEVYSSRVNLREQWLDAPTSLIISAIQTMVLELRLYDCRDSIEDGAVAYLTTIFQVVSQRLTALQSIDIADPEAFLSMALDYAHRQGLDSEDVSEIIAEHIRKTNEVST